MKIKLRDITIDDLQRFKTNVCCDLEDCENCPLKNVNCNENSKYYWVCNKDMFSDKFLNQEIEIDPILNEKEKEYLRIVIKPFRDKVEHIVKYVLDETGKDYIEIELENDCLVFPYFKSDKYYKNMEPDKEYTLEELGL